MQPKMYSPSLFGLFLLSTYECLQRNIWYIRYNYIFVYIFYMFWVPPEEYSFIFTKITSPSSFFFTIIDFL